MFFLILFEKSYLSEKQIRCNKIKISVSKILSRDKSSEKSERQNIDYYRWFTCIRIFKGWFFFLKTTFSLLCIIKILKSLCYYIEGKDDRDRSIRDFQSDGNAISLILNRRKCFITRRAQRAIRITKGANVDSIFKCSYSNSGYTIYDIKVLCYFQSFSSSLFYRIVWN